MSKTWRGNSDSKYTDGNGTWGDDDKDFHDQLSGDEADFFFNFHKDWGQESRRKGRQDISNKYTRLPMDIIETTPTTSWENAIIRAIDEERHARSSDDIEPGIIKKGPQFQCSFFTPQKTLRAFFADLDSARHWLANVKREYGKVSR